MDSMSGCDIRLVFTFPPKDSTLQYKKSVHLKNNFPCIITLAKRIVMVIEWCWDTMWRGSIKQGKQRKLLWLKNQVSLDNCRSLNKIKFTYRKIYKTDCLFLKHKKSFFLLLFYCSKTIRSLVLYFFRQCPSLVEDRGVSVAFFVYGQDSLANSAVRMF